MRWITKKRAFVALGCTCALAVAGVAIAYFTSNGSGTGTATVGSSSAVTLHATITGNLFPGSSSPVTFTVDNPSSGVQRVGTVSLASISVDAGHSGCSTTISGGNPDFTMAAVPGQPGLPARQRPERLRHRDPGDERNRHQPGRLPGRDADAAPDQQLVRRG